MEEVKNGEYAISVSDVSESKQVQQDVVTDSAMQMSQRNLWNSLKDE